MQNMPLATGKNEGGFADFLHMRTDNSLHIFFGILSDLLKLINGNNAWFVGSVKILKNFL